MMTHNNDVLMRDVEIVVLAEERELEALIEYTPQVYIPTAIGGIKDWTDEQCDYYDVLTSK